MSTNKTQNYQLPLWEPNDAVLHTEFNEANQKLDAALTDLSSQCVKKTGDIMTGALTIAADPNNRPDKLHILPVIPEDGTNWACFDCYGPPYIGTARIQLSSRDYDSIYHGYLAQSSARFLPLAELQYGTYIGTGTFGVSSPNSLTFAIPPKLLFISTENTANSTVIFAKGGTVADGVAPGTIDSQIHVAWGQFSVSWYNTYAAAGQLNNKDQAYHWVAVI